MERNEKRASSPPFYSLRWEELNRNCPVGDALPLTDPLVIIFNALNCQIADYFSESLFTAQELTRARRFRFEANRREYLATRGILRSFISRSVSLSPDKIIFEARRNEKPQLLNSECAGINVSLSHAGGWVACALIKNRQVGIDIEVINNRSNLNVKMLARRIFSATEMKGLGRLSDSDFLRLFFRGWTRKESVLKGAGVGLSVEPNTVEVFRSSAHGVLEEISPVRLAGQMWDCHSQSPTPGLELSVAYDANQF